MRMSGGDARADLDDAWPRHKGRSSRVPFSLQGLGLAIEHVLEATASESPTSIECRLLDRAMRWPSAASSDFLLNSRTMARACSTATASGVIRASIWHGYIAVS